MEMPIEVIITLFIVLFVGALLVVFSQTIIGSAEKQLPGIDDAKKGEMQVLEVSEVTNSQIGMLVDECFQTRFGKVFKEETCFIVHSSSLYRIGSSSDINAYTTNKEALRPIVDVDKNVNTVLIIWDFANTGVEVSA